MTRITRISAICHLNPRGAGGISLEFATRAGVGRAARSPVAEVDEKTARSGEAGFFCCSYNASSSRPDARGCVAEAGWMRDARGWMLDAGTSCGFRITPGAILV